MWVIITLRQCLQLDHNRHYMMTVKVIMMRTVVWPQMKETMYLKDHALITTSYDALILYYTAMLFILNSLQIVYHVKILDGETN